jgi:hypothetical protein
MFLVEVSPSPSPSFLPDNIFGVPIFLFLYIFLQYVAMAVGGLYIFYNTRLKICFRAVFLRRVEMSGEGSGDFYSLVKKDKVTGDEASDFDVVRSGGKGDYIWVGDKDFCATAKEVSFRKKTFFPDLSCLAFRKYGAHLLYFDFDSGSLLTFGGEVRSVEPNFAERHLRSGVLAKFLLEAGMMPKMFWIMVVVLTVCVGFGMFFVGWFVADLGNHTVVKAVFLR